MIRSMEAGAFFRALQRCITKQLKPSNVAKKDRRRLNNEASSEDCQKGQVTNRLKDV